MEANKPTKTKLPIRASAFIFSPLALAFLWCAFVDQEGFGAFVLGVLFTGLFGLLALGRFLAGKSPPKPPGA